MFNFGLLETLFGLAVLFFFLSLVISAATELLSAQQHWRAKILRGRLSNMLGTVADDVYRHELICALQPKDDRDPAYIPPRLFALVILQIVIGQNKTVLMTSDELRKALENITGSDQDEPKLLAALDQAMAFISVQPDEQNTLADVPAALSKIKSILISRDKNARHRSGDLCSIANGLLLLLDNSQGVTANRADNWDGFLKQIEDWFNAVMDRASGAYKRRTRLTVCLLAALITFWGNIDTLAIVNRLWSDSLISKSLDQMPSKVVADAEGGAVSVQVIPDKTGKPNIAFSSQTNKPLNEAPTIQGLSQALVKAERDALRFPVGWSSMPSMTPFDGHKVNKILGWLLTVLAISLGAPFWYDLLNRLVSLRTSGPLPPASGNLSSQTPIPPTSQQAPQLTGVTTLPSGTPVLSINGLNR